MKEDECNNEIEAENLFLQGAELERNNNHYDAIRYYRKALQLVPDIDIKVYKKSKLKESNKYSVEDKENHTVHENTEIICDDDDDYDDNEPLYQRFQRILGKQDRLCTPSKPHNALHVSNLPAEVIAYIFRWVVSDELDLRSLDQCSLVCRGFYLCARDSHIWKSACQRIWKDDQLLPIYDSWREMFLNRPRVSTNGCYIGETKYYRQGERSFQDQHFKPYHLVVYYRYFRFFADGTVLMLNTVDLPAVVVGQLKNKNAKLGTFVTGTYRLANDLVFVTFKMRRASKESILRPCGKTKMVTVMYHMTFQIKKYKKWKSKLMWKEYKWSCVDEESYNENFEIRENVFPALFFSRVKSYHAESEKELA